MMQINRSPAAEKGSRLSAAHSPAHPAWVGLICKNFTRYTGLGKEHFTAAFSGG
jgi:hypothetical protein